MNIKELNAPCGLGCFACATYKDNITVELAHRKGAVLRMAPGDVPVMDAAANGAVLFPALWQVKKAV